MFYKHIKTNKKDVISLIFIVQNLDFSQKIITFAPDFKDYLHLRFLKNVKKRRSHAVFWHFGDLIGR